MKSRGIPGQITLKEYLATIDLEDRRPQKAPKEPPEDPGRALEPANRPAVPPHVRSFLLAGAGRPGARIRIQRAIQEAAKTSAPAESSINVYKIVVDELSGAQGHGVEIHRRGIRDREAGWRTWACVIDWISRQIAAGTWIPEEEMQTEVHADLDRRNAKRGWRL